MGTIGERKAIVADPGVRSWTITVPASVPSLTHSSAPWTPSSPTNSTPVPNGTTHGLLDDAARGVIALMRTVPATVPSVFHRAVPPPPPLAKKNSSPPAVAPGPIGSGWMSFNGWVPTGVPSVTQS